LLFEVVSRGHDQPRFSFFIACCASR
jgi:hypothetical protein